jgi:hypothetical protein
MVIEIRGGKSPHEVALLLACVLLGGVSVIAFDRVASASARALPIPWGLVMYAGLVVTALVALIGVFSRGVVGALTERIGLWSSTAWCLGYGVIIVANSGARGILFGGFMLSVAIAHVVRARQISAEIDQMIAARTLTAVTTDGERP